MPPSLLNIYKELEEAARQVSARGPLPTLTGLETLYDDLGIKNTTTCLDIWAERGIFLLNTTMTVREGQAGSHFGKGWEKFTDAVILKLAQRKEPMVFVLWGRNARQKANIIREYKQHMVHESNHPSPLSCHKGFFGSKPFSKCNDFLGDKVINWKIDNII